MFYCRKCGAQLNEDDLFCFKCGQPVDAPVNASEAGITNSVSVSGTSAVLMSKEESIALAEKLKNEYVVVDRLQKEVNENESALKRPIVFSGRRYSAFRFFWPFFIYAYLALNAVLIIGVIASSGDDTGTGITVSFLFSLGAAVGLLIFGGIRAKNKRDSLNEQLANDEFQMARRYKERESNTAELKTKLMNKRNELREYQTLVPAKFRSKYYMDRVIILLQTGKAESFTEAIKLLNK